MGVSNLVKAATKEKKDDFVYDPQQRDPSNLDSDSQDNDNYSQSSAEKSQGDGGDNSNSTDDYGNTTLASSKEATDAFADSLAKKLTRDVKVWRSLVTTMLLLTAILVTVSTYLILQREEKEDFEQGVSFSHRHGRRFVSSLAIANPAWRTCVFFAIL